MMKIIAFLLAACLTTAVAQVKDVSAVVKRVKASPAFQDAMNRLNELVGSLVNDMVSEAMDEVGTANGVMSGHFWEDQEREFELQLPERLEAYRRTQQKAETQSHDKLRTTTESSSNRDKTSLEAHNTIKPRTPNTGASGDTSEGRERPSVLWNQKQIDADNDSNTGDNDMGVGEETKTESTNRAPTKVAVLGCGPGGMFFLHALATKRRKLQQAGDLEGLAALPEVTVYEKTPQPGGVWRETTDDTPPGSVGMFGGLWTNSASYNLEFFDFTLDKYFNETLPMYLPRKHMLEYMIARVTSVENVFQHVKFNTQVTSVDYDDNREKFEVVATNLVTGAKTVNEYDKFVWAGGVYSKPNYPRTIIDMLEDGGYSGLSMHSSDLYDIGSALRGKKILLVGDNLSALDLTLQAIKADVEHVYITSGKQKGYTSNIPSWPENRATYLPCLPTQVINNGTGLMCSPVSWNTSIAGYVPNPKRVNESVGLADIDAVIFCTGYRTDMDYLSTELRMRCQRSSWSAPKGWRSKPNCLSKEVGHVKPSSELRSRYVCDNLYRHILISNPNMMYIHTMTSNYIPEIDAQAWALAAYVSGDRILPTKKEMELRNYLELLEELNVPYLRQSHDAEYMEALVPLYSDCTHWLNTEFEDAKFFEYYKENAMYANKIIARDQLDGGHGAEWGSFDKLSARGELVVDQLTLEWDDDWGDAEWWTFRDVDPRRFQSVYTGSKFVPLKAPWMYLDDDGNPIIPRNLSMTTEGIIQVQKTRKPVVPACRGPGAEFIASIES